MIVDTHAHIYHGDETQYPMIEDPFRPSSGIGTIEHLRREAQANGVGRVVLIQTGSAYRWDNRLLADTARANADWTVGVCTLDPAGDDSPDELERLVTGYNVKGVRLEAAPAGYDQPGAERLWHRAGENRRGKSAAHLRREQLGELAALLARFPHVPVVLDHCAYPVGANGIEDAAVRQTADLARFDQLHAKLTFAVTSSQQEYPLRRYAPAATPLASQLLALSAVSGDRISHVSTGWKNRLMPSTWRCFTEELGLSAAEQEQVLGGDGYAAIFF